MMERSIALKAWEVRAIQAGKKTQVRRIACKGTIPAQYVTALEYEPERWRLFDACSPGVARAQYTMPRCPYGVPGDRLWIKEPFFIGEDLGEDWEPWMSQGDRFRYYPVGGDEVYDVPQDYLVPRRTREYHNSEGTPEHWRGFGPIPGPLMPRWASRLLLEVTAVRVERLGDISEMDAAAEGLESIQVSDGGESRWVNYAHPESRSNAFGDARASYWSLWKKLYGPSASATNPWLWAIEFKRVMS